LEYTTHWGVGGISSHKREKEQKRKISQKVVGRKKFFFEGASNPVEWPLRGRSNVVREKERPLVLQRGAQPHSSNHQKNPT